MQKMKTMSVVLALVAAISAQAITNAVASDWCGENGLIRFSFAEGPELVQNLETAEPTNGVTTINLYAWLTDVDEVSRAGEKFLRVGGIEMKLSIEGAEAFLLKQEFPSQVLNVGAEVGSIVAGYVPGQRLHEGKTLLVQWQIMFQGRPENVRFGLDPAGVMSCATTEGCLDAEPPAVYVGVESSGQLGSLFGAGYSPAWLNPAGKPNAARVHAKQTYQEVGLFK